MQPRRVCWFGQNRLDKCDATKSKSGKHRNFHDSCEFIQVVRHMLNTQTFGDGEDAEDRHLTEAEVDRIIAEAAAPVETEARLVCEFCRNRVVAACLQLAQQAEDDDGLRSLWNYSDSDVEDGEEDYEMEAMLGGLGW